MRAPGWYAAAGQPLFRKASSPITSTLPGTSAHARLTHLQNFSAGTRHRNTEKQGVSGGGCGGGRGAADAIVGWCTAPVRVLDGTQGTVCACVCVCAVRGMGGTRGAQRLFFQTDPSNARAPTTRTPCGRISAARLLQL